MAIRDLLTLPNILSASRIPLAAGFLLIEKTPLRLALLGMASATDLLDGWIARRTGRTTQWGAIIDPIADKLFVLAALTAFLVRDDLSARDYVVLLSRDIATSIGAVMALALPGVGPRDFGARLSGKVVTVLQLLALLALCVAPRSMGVIVVVVGVASIVSIADYTLALAVALGRRR
ncbi:MAG: CDP-alcohol phosphatidyltransferase family protein [Anaerolineae bacterium]|nr:CDP-alcohol phosphatidyltransferase family protein [Gemmatimonadaceae bacterium]